MCELSIQLYVTAFFFSFFSKNKRSKPKPKKQKYKTPKQNKKILKHQNIPFQLFCVICTIQKKKKILFYISSSSSFSFFSCFSKNQGKKKNFVVSPSFFFVIIVIVKEKKKKTTPFACSLYFLRLLLVYLPLVFLLWSLSCVCDSLQKEHA